MWYTAAELREDGFGPNPFFRCLVAEETGRRSASADAAQENNKLSEALILNMHWSLFSSVKVL
jgi:hypothetical protein